MKKIIGLFLFIAWSSPVFSQKLSKDESRKMTQEQRIVYESDRKSKGGKKKLSMKKKTKIDKKQARKAKRMKQAKRS